MLTSQSRNNYYDFLSNEFLTGHGKAIIDFYLDNCINADGGYFQYFTGDGEAQTSRTESHLVSLSRLIYNFSVAAREFGDQRYCQAAEHGVDYLLKYHLNVETGGYAWEVDRESVINSTNKCYGLAHVILALSHAARAGIENVGASIEEAYQVLQQRFAVDEHSLYVNEVSADWKEVASYRGQNANMHCCEALIAAYETTGAVVYFNRAMDIARSVVVEQTESSGGLIWEHYSSDWSLDFDFNKGNTTDKFLPWGYQPGHLAEWAKLLLQLYRIDNQDWLVERAEFLFSMAIELGFDSQSGGYCYVVSPDLKVRNTDKYAWVQAEVLAASGVLAAVTNGTRYREIYHQQWLYVLEHFWDPKTNTWFRALDCKNTPLDQSSEAMGKTDYHAMSLVAEMLNTTVHI